MTIPLPSRAVPTVLLVLVIACAGGEGEAPPPEAPPDAPDRLTAVEIEQGLGPIRDLQLADVDAELAALGETAFTTKCSACHRIDSRFVAPALGDVLARRRPEFVMNMILNADEMVRRHPAVRELLAEFYTPMPTQVRDPEEARAILEFLRSVQTASLSPGEPTGDR